MVAGPGYGKTSFMMDLLKSAPGFSAYYALDEAAQQPNRFLTCLMLTAGLKPREWLMNGTSDYSAIEDNQDCTTVILASEIVTFMAANAGRTSLLAIDDLHMVDANPKVAASLRLIIPGLPPNWTLILASRTPIPLNKLRLGGRLVEIQARQLCFTPSEIQDYARQTRGIELRRSEAQAIWRATHGWPAAVAGLGPWLTTSPDVRTAIDARVGLGDDLSHYLEHDILARLQRFEHDVMLTAGLLPRVALPRDEAFLPGRPGEAEAVLDDFVARGFFVTRTGHRTFTVHPLVRECARRRALRDTPGAAGLVAAAAHVEQTGDHGQAVSYYLMAGHLESASRAIRSMVIESTHPGLAEARVEWLPLLPQPPHDDPPLPWLLVAGAALHQNQGDYRRATELYEAAASCLLATDDRQGTLSVLVGWAFCLASQSLHEEALAVVERCRGLADSAQQRVELLATEAAQLLQLCRWNKAMAKYDEALALTPADAPWSLTSRMRIGANKSVMLHHLGFYERGRAEIERVLSICDSKTSFLYALALNNAATMNIRTGNYDQARRQVDEAERLSLSHGYSYIECPVLLNRTLLAEADGQSRQAFALAKRALKAALHSTHKGDEYWCLLVIGDICRRAKNAARALAVPRSGAGGRDRARRHGRVRPRACPHPHGLGHGAAATGGGSGEAAARERPHREGRRTQRHVGARVPLPGLVARPRRPPGGDPPVPLHRNAPRRGAPPRALPLPGGEGGHADLGAV